MNQLNINDEHSPSTAPLILVVDDEDIIRKSSKIMLERCNYRAITAADGREAVELYQKNAAEIRLIILDLAMPGITGEETAADILKINPEALIVLTSGYEDEPPEPEPNQAKVAGFLRKPYGMNTLQHTVETILKQK